MAKTSAPAYRAERRAVDPSVRGEHPWTRVDVASLLALVAVGLVSLPWLVYEHFLANVDAALYILTSKAWLAGEGYSYLGEPFQLRPPGLPILLAPLLGWFGTNFEVLNLATNLMGLVAVAFLFVYARPQLGGPGALVLGLVVWMHPLFRETCNSTLSDAPGLALLFAALLAERHFWRVRGSSEAVVLGLVLAAGLWVRSVTILFVPAFFVSWLLRGGLFGRRRLERSHVLIALVTPLVLIAPWWWRNSRLEPPRPALETAMASQSTAMWHRDKADPDSPRLTAREVLERVPENAERLARQLSSGLTEEQPRSEGPTPALSAPIWPGAVALAVAAIALLARRSPAGFYLVAHVLVLCIWHTSRPRLALPVYALALPTLAALLSGAVRRVAAPASARAVVAAALVALGAVHVLRTPDWSANTSDFLSRRELAEQLTRELSRQAVLSSDWGWYESLLLDRPVRPFRQRVHRYGAERALAELRGLGVTHVIAPRRSRQYGEFVRLVEGEGEVVAEGGRLRVHELRRP